MVQLLRSVSVTSAVTEATTDAITLPLLHGSVIGPLLMAASAFAMWRLWRRDQPAEAGGWEALAGVALPRLGMAALVLLPWQTFMPMWAAAATALLALAAFAVSVRCDLAPLRAVVLAMQALALVSFIATLHRGAVGEAALRSGWQGMAAPALIGLGMVATTAWSLRQSHRDAPAGGAQPARPLAPSVALRAAVSLLHLAMLFGIDLPHAALVWPFTAARWCCGSGCGWVMRRWPRWPAPCIGPRPCCS